MKLTIRNHGPYRLEGEDIVLTDEAGNRYGLGGRKVVSLCRCGHSENKPFCDGTHNKIGFQSAPLVRDLEPPKPKV